MAGQITVLLNRWQAGEVGAENELFSRVYRELETMASIRLVKERIGHTLEPAALVNETFLKLIREGVLVWQNRQHFFSVAATQMWRVLVDHGRRRHAKKRGDAAKYLSLPEALPSSGGLPEDNFAIGEALDSLSRHHRRAARVVSLRIFVGLTWSEVAQNVDVSMATAKNDWTFGKAFLLAQLSDVE